MRTPSLTAASFLLAGALMAAQSAAAAEAAPPCVPAAGATTGLMHAIHATNEVDKTLGFYTDVFGIQGKINAFTNPNVPILTNSPGVSLKVTMLRIPGDAFNWELTQFMNYPRTPGQAQLSDPGAPHMKILVRDLEPVVAAVKRLNAPIITTSQAPVTIDEPLVGKVKAIYFRDPDGYIVEAIQVTPPANAPEGNVVGAIIGITIGDLDTASKFWHGIMGFDLKGDGKFSTDKAKLDLMGVKPGGSFRTYTSMVPGSCARVEFTEFKGMARKPFSLRVPDPGASGAAIRVADIEQLLPRVKAAGYQVLSRDGALVHWDDKTRNFFVKDPGGLNFELVGTVQPTAAAAAPPAG